MKLRIHNNSIRLRLTQTEIAQLSRAQIIESRVDLIPEPMSFKLQATSDCQSPAVTFQRGCLQIAVPLPAAAQLAETDQVGIDAQLPAAPGRGGSIQLLIEKDFKCLHGPAEDQADCFANPRE